MMEKQLKMSLETATLIYKYLKPSDITFDIIKGSPSWIFRKIIEESFTEEELNGDALSKVEQDLNDIKAHEQKHKEALKEYEEKFLYKHQGLYNLAKERSSLEFDDLPPEGKGLLMAANHEVTVR